MSKLLILLLMFGLLFNGCNDNSQQKNNFNIDTEAPVQPRVVIGTNNTFSTKAELKVSGEPEGAVIVDGKIVGQINEDGTATVKLPLSGADGLKEIKVTIEDAYGNRSEPTIVKVYKDTIPPQLQLLGDKTTTLEIGEKFVEPGFSVKDNLDSSVKVEVTGNVNSTMVGRYYIYYTTVDNAGNTTVKVRKVIVKEKEVINNFPQYNGSLNNIDANDSQNITIDVQKSFSDLDGDTLTYTATGLPTSLTLKDGAISGTLANDASATSPYNITVIAKDPSGASVQASFTVTVTNPAPVYISGLDDRNSSEESAIQQELSSSFSDPDGDTLTYSATNLPNGLSLSSSGKLDGRIFGGASANSPYGVTITAKDTQGATVDRKFNWNITDKGFRAVDDTVETYTKRPVSFYPYENDIDSNNTSVTIKSKPANGIALMDNNGTITYVPNKDFTGVDSFSYSICANNAVELCDSAKVTVNILRAVNNSNYIKTNWGFQDFVVPDNNTTLSPGGNIQTAIDSLKAQGGGTITLNAGLYSVRNLKLTSNIIIKGAGIGQTTLKTDGHGDMMEARDSMENIVVKDMTIDCTDNGDYNCIEFNYGTHNVLVENIHIFGAGRSNILAWNEDWSEAGHFTVENVISHNTVKYHGIALRFLKGAVAANNSSYRVFGDGIDVSTNKYAEITNNSITDTAYGMKFPRGDYLYIHDNLVSNVWVEGGIKFNPDSEAYNQEHIDLENNKVEFSRGGIIDWGDAAPAPHFAEFISRNNSVSDDYNGMNMVRIANGIALYDYGDNVKDRDGGTIEEGDEFEQVYKRTQDQDPYNTDGVGYKSWGSPELVGNIVYKPALDFSLNDVYKNAQVVEVSDTTELKNAINSASAKTTILLRDGEYTDVNILFPKGLHDITIKAKGESAVIIPKGREDSSAFTLPNVATQNEQVHNVNFVGLKIKGSSDSYKQFVKAVNGRWVDGGGTLHDYGKNNPKYGAYKIYFYKIETEKLFMGLYSGLHAHDWTVDSCSVKTSAYSHFWYMMGWHLGVINSTFEDATPDALALRGYYPDGEVHTYIGVPNSTQCYGNVYVKNRESRARENGFLAPNDWTHAIRNNTFKRISTIRHNDNAYVAVAYSIYADDPICGAEKTYLPPQNIEISHNEFNNTNEESSATNHAISISGYSGINNDTLPSINGISIYNNMFYRVKSSEKFIVTNNANTNLDDLDKNSVKNNKIVDLP